METIITSVEKRAQELQAELQSRGIQANYSVSDTDYGVSCYLVFCRSFESNDKLKIRISDHSVTNRYRMSEEQHYQTNMNVIHAANLVEGYLRNNKVIEHPTHIAIGDILNHTIWGVIEVLDVKGNVLTVNVNGETKKIMKDIAPISIIN